MIVHCETCKMWFEDVFRSTECPHAAFPANDGRNNFRVHEDAYLSGEAPEPRAVYSAHRKEHS